MKIARIKVIRNCSQSNNQIDLFFDDKISREFLGLLALSGKLEVFDNFEKPFFRLHYKNKYVLKGALGNKKARLFLPESNCDEILAEFKTLINSIN
ncbi:MAG: hypothetical protein EPN82_15670 [Bacteroidetes bacterium]|nr:MAG: hypothetical protein EPN82_15670 [Bacteroidota bacterium]